MTSPLWWHAKCWYWWHHYLAALANQQVPPSTTDNAQIRAWEHVGTHPLAACAWGLVQNFGCRWQKSRLAAVHYVKMLQNFHLPAATLQEFGFLFARLSVPVLSLSLSFSPLFVSFCPSFLQCICSATRAFQCDLLVASRQWVWWESILYGAFRGTGTAGHFSNGSL